MDKKIVKIIPILFLIILVASIINTIYEDLPSSVSTGIVLAESMVSVCIIEFLVFYIDYKKNKSVISIIGLIGIALYITLNIVYLIMSKNILKSASSYESLKSSYKLLKTFGNIEQTTMNIISMLKYYSIFNLINNKNNDQISTLAQIGAYLAVFIHYGISIGAIFSEKALPKFITITNSASYQCIKIFVFTFVIYQLFAEDEIKVAKALEESASKPSNPQAFQTNGPRFRNPALEAQEARLAQQQNQSQQQQVMNSQQMMPQQQLVNNQQMYQSQPMMNPQQMMSQQPLVNNQQMYQPQPMMNSQQILSQPPISNEQNSTINSGQNM